MTDEREGLPSASNFDRFEKCRGSWQAEQGLPDESNEMSRAGDLGHACLAGEIHIDELDAETAKTVAVIKKIEEHTLEDCGYENAEQIREKRLWFDIDGVKQFSGKPDLICLLGKEAFVIDYKPGPLPVEPAAANMQLRALLVLVDHNFGPFETIKTGIIQPRNHLNPATFAQYDRAAIMVSYVQVLDLLADVEKETPPRNATESGCRYCKAKTTCPETEKNMIEIYESNLPAVPNAELLEKCAIVKKVIAKIEANAKAALKENPEAIPGYKLKPGATRQQITSPEGVFYQAAIHGVDGQEFAAVCDVNKTKLKALIKDKTGHKGKQLDETLANILEGNTTEKQNAPSLAKDFRDE